jgi:hypothetical protein
MPDEEIANPQREFRIGWGPCCFCGLPIATTMIDPCRLTVETEAGKWQLWFCHGACFKNRLMLSPTGFFDPAHF